MPPHRVSLLIQYFMPLYFVESIVLSSRGRLLSLSLCFFIFNFLNETL